MGVFTNAFGIGVGQGALLNQYNVDFSILPDGVMPFGAGSTFKIIGGKAVNTPVLGAEKCTDPGFENWTNATTPAAPWNKFASGTSTVNREATIKTGGNYAARLDIDSSNSETYVVLSSFLTTGKSYKIAVNSRSDSGAPTFSFVSSFLRSFTVNSVFARYSSILLSGATYFVLDRLLAAGRSLYFDDMSIKEVLINNMFCLRDFKKTDFTVSSKLSLNQNGLAGIVCCANSLVAPTSYVMLYENMIDNHTHFIKVVNGVTTSLYNSINNYIANNDVSLAIVKKGNQFSIFEGGLQIIAPFTINDAEIINNTNHGIYADDDTTVFNNFSCKNIGTGSIALSFDDGWISIYSQAFQYMKGKVNATLYVSTGFIDGVLTPSPAYEPMMTHQNVQEMDANGWDIANHSVSHSNFSTLTEAQQEAEISGASAALTGWGLTRANMHFAYPYGAFDNNSFIALANLGMKTARRASTVGLNVLLNKDFTTPYLLPMAFGTAATTTLADLQAVVNTALVNGTTALIYTHQLVNGATGSATELSVYKSFIDWLIAQGITTLTITQLYDKIK